MVDTVLVAVDDELSRMEPVATTAAEIAAGLDADVRLFHVFGEAEFETYLEEFGYEAADPVEIARKHAVVQDCAAIFQEHDVEPEIEAAIGDPSTEITAYVTDNDVDHVFMGGHRRSAAGKALLGSVSQKVLRQVEVPCTISMQ